MNGLAPPYLSKLFLKRNEIHDLNTRNNKALHIPQHKTVSGQRTFYYRAVKLWNNLDEDLKNRWRRHCVLRECPSSKLFASDTYVDHS